MNIHYSQTKLILDTGCLKTKQMFANNVSSQGVFHNTLNLYVSLCDFWSAFLNIEFQIIDSEKKSVHSCR